MYVRMIKSKANFKKTRVPVEGLFCSYSHRTCMHNRLDGFEYCLRHILEDKNTPFKQCSYVSNRSSKRCNNAAPKADKRDGYCTEHAKKAQVMRQKANRKRRPQETPESILEELEHYGTKAITNEQGAEIRRPRPNSDSVANRILDYASSSESDTEPLLVDQAWRGDGDSDAESVDNEMEDPLKLAGVYTAEEVALITRDKLIRLQSLYIDQFKRLQHIMKEKRRKYIHASRHEKDKFGSIHALKDDPDQRDKYDKLMAMKRYHKRNGKEALLHRQSKERRIAVSEGVNYKPLSHLKCVQVVDAARCSERVVPLSKYCQKHILSDSHQILFQTCRFGNGACKSPVPKGTEEPTRCMLHQTFLEPKPHVQQSDPAKQVDCEEEINVNNTENSTSSSQLTARENESASVDPSPDQSAAPQQADETQTLTEKPESSTDTENKTDSEAVTSEGCDKKADENSEITVTSADQSTSAASKASSQDLVDDNMVTEDSKEDAVAMEVD